IRQVLTPDDFTTLGAYSAESNALLNAMEGSGKVDLSGFTLYPCVVPDRDAPQETMDAALHLLQQMIDRGRPAPPPEEPSPAPPASKPWWKVW
ncbi:MAG TPA: hypothetical protein VFR81_18730, partial [Longimicrobium sp.]|nr:hypothetical protein [Longimicrobium sp.]